CATGLLTERLAARCDALLAIDMMPRAIERTRARVAGLPQVETRVAALPQAWPAGRFDLIVLSELGYYFDREPWLRTVAQAAQALALDGTIVACHWLRPFAERAQSTRHVHAAIARCPGLHRHVRHIEPDFLLDVWSRNPEPLRSREPMR
ncbi:SAM-dependent methyltransferase, partial [Cupriavidus sp. CER94]|uniref:SAM-dependent methyltransferase n=1 Tax=Cupriavidus sp. CER94 TaxID=3377036 RepID=UPI00381EFB6A